MKFSVTDSLARQLNPTRQGQRLSVSSVTSTVWCCTRFVLFIIIQITIFINSNLSVNISGRLTWCYYDKRILGKFVGVRVRGFEVRSFIRFWDNRGYSKNWGSPCIPPRSLFSQIFKGLLFAWTLWIYLPSLRFVALPVPEVIGGTQKIWAVPGYAHAPFSPKFFMGLCSDGPCEYIGQICSP